MMISKTLEETLDCSSIRECLSAADGRRMDEHDTEAEYLIPDTAFFIAGSILVLIAVVIYGLLLNETMETRSVYMKPPKEILDVCDFEASSTRRSKLIAKEIRAPENNLFDALRVTLLLSCGLFILGGIQKNAEATYISLCTFPFLIIAFSIFKVMQKKEILLKEAGDISNPQVRDGVPHVLTNIWGQALKDSEAHDIFEHLGRTFVSAAVLGISQLLLMGFYLWGIWDEREDLDFGKEGGKRTYAFFFLGLILQSAYIVGKLPREHNTRRLNFWSTIIACSLKTESPKKKQGVETKSEKEDKSPKKKNGNEFYCIWKGLNGWVNESSRESDGLAFLESQGYNVRTLTRTEALLRFLLSVLVNDGGLCLIVLAFPIQICRNESAVDVVLNVIAAFYILELDDLADPVKLYPLHNMNYIEKSSTMKKLKDVKEEEKEEECGEDAPSIEHETDESGRTSTVQEFDESGRTEIDHNVTFNIEP